MHGGISSCEAKNLNFPQNIRILRILQMLVDPFRLLINRLDHFAILKRHIQELLRTGTSRIRIRTEPTGATVDRVFVLHHSNLLKSVSHELRVTDYDSPE